MCLHSNVRTPSSFLLIFFLSIVSSVGIFAMLDEECVVPKGSDTGLLEKMQQRCVTLSRAGSFSFLASLMSVHISSAAEKAHCILMFPFCRHAKHAHFAKAKAKNSFAVKHFAGTLNTLQALTRIFARIFLWFTRFRL